MSRTKAIFCKVSRTWNCLKGRLNFVKNIESVRLCLQCYKLSGNAFKRRKMSKHVFKGIRYHFFK